MKLEKNFITNNNNNNEMKSIYIYVLWKNAYKIYICALYAAITTKTHIYYFSSCF